MLKQLAIDVVCLQESHLKKREERYVKQMFWEHIYHAISRSHTNGIMLGIRSRILQKPRDAHLDENGHYIILRSCLNHLLITLIAIYAPIDQQVISWRELLNRVDIDTPHVIILGNFNAVNVADMNKSRYTRYLITPRILHTHPWVGGVHHVLVDSNTLLIQRKKKLYILFNVP